MEERILIFEVEKETKNTVRFAERPEPGTPAIVGTIYVQKWAFPGPVPQTITVTIKGN